MKEIIAIVSRKGGSGKTTTAQAIGAVLMERKQTVLFIDLDAQRNLSQSMGADLTRPNITNLFEGAAAADVIQQTNNGDIIPGSKYLDAADMILNTNKELARALDNAKLNYDYIIIDTPASPGRLTLNALTAADKVIITAAAEPYSLDGLTDLLATINQVKDVNKRLEILGIVVTRYDGRSNAAKRTLESFRQKAIENGIEVIEPPIRATAKVFDAQGARCNLTKYAPKATATQDYRAVTDRIL